MNYEKWLKINTESLDGKRVVITGATGGIGHALCLFLAKLGANLTILARNESKFAQLKNDINGLYPNANINLISTDLFDLNSVKYAIEELKKYNGIDVLILNAGIYNVPLEKSSCGYNNVFQVNFLSQYYLIKELLPELKKKENSVCVATSSIALNYSKIDENDIDFSLKKSCSKIYGNSKRFLTFALFELFKNEKDVRLSIVHPGITFTNITAHYPKVIFAIIKHPMKLIFMQPKKASLSILKGVFIKTDYCEWIGPKIFNVWGLPNIKKLNVANSDEIKKIASITKSIFDKLI